VNFNTSDYQTIRARAQQTVAPWESNVFKSQDSNRQCCKRVASACKCKSQIGNRYRAVVDRIKAEEKENSKIN